MRDFLQTRSKLATTLAIAGLAFVATLLLGAQEDEKKDEVVLQMTATFRGHYTARESMKDVRYVSEGKTDDQVTVTLTGTSRWKIDRNWPEDMDGARFELVSKTFIVTVTGSGESTSRRTERVNCPPSYAERELVKTATTTWTYQGGGNTDSPGFGLSLKSGWFKIIIPDPRYRKIEKEFTSSGTMEVISQTCAGTEEKFSMPHRGVGIAYSASWYDPMDFTVMNRLQEKFTVRFEPNPKQFMRTGSLSSSYTLPAETVNTDPRRFKSHTTGTLEVSYTLGYNAEPEDVEAVMWAEGYDKWLPEGQWGGREDESGLEPVHVKVKLQVKGKPQEEVREKATFRFELVDVSTEPGVCINWPHQDNEALKGTPDLAIEDIHNPKLAVDATWQTNRGKAGPKAKTKEKGTKAEVLISSFDYGSYGTLKIYADLERGGTIVADLKDKPSVKELKIPRDDNNNHIADAWEEEKGLMGVAADSDDDFYPRGDGTKGDGLSVFEEYRGFMMLTEDGVKHKRTSPMVKTLFINYTDIPDVKPGVELFQNAGGLQVIPINEEQYGSNTHRVININSKTSRSGIAQHGLWVKSWVSDKWGGQSPIGPPKFVDKVEIAQNNPDTIAHELGHAVGMPHDGKGNYDIRSTVRTSAYVAIQHGQNSGGEPCIMRYHNADYVETIEGTRKKLYPYYRPNEKTEKRTQFCTEDKGTGVNAPHGWTLPDGRRVSKAGDATRDCGNSLRYIRISDKYGSPRPGHVQRGCL